MNQQTIIVLGRLTAAALSGTPVRFIYMDEDGVTSLRYVEVESVEVSHAGDPFVRTFDLNRKDARSFRIDRIIYVA